METIERILGIYFLSLYREGKRLVELRSLALVLEIVRGVRRITLVHYFSFVSCSVMVAGIFAVVVHAITQFEASGLLYLDPVMVGGLGLIVAGGGVTLWALSEKRWIKAFGLDRAISHASKPKAEEMGVRQNNINYEHLGEVIDKMIDEKLNKMTDKLAQDMGLEPQQEEGTQETELGAPAGSRKFGTA